MSARCPACGDITGANVGSQASCGCRRSHIPPSKIRRMPARHAPRLKKQIMTTATKKFLDIPQANSIEGPDEVGNYDLVVDLGTRVVGLCIGPTPSISDEAAVILKRQIAWLMEGEEE